jgi:hypothetical protein
MSGRVRFIALVFALTGATLGAAQSNPGRFSRAGVVRATATVDSVFVARTLESGRIEGGDWASYLLARLGAGPIPDTLAITVTVDSTGIQVNGRLQDLPLEARRLLGPLASMVDSSTVVAADVGLRRSGREVIRFFLRGLRVNGFPFPEFLLTSMMAQVGRQYPALTASGRDLYVQVPADGTVRLAPGAVLISIAAADSTRTPTDTARAASPPS